jgi:polyhydroxybutyrate depolymerase
MFHGGGANARITQEHYGWDSLADSEGFMVAYPDGTGGFMDRVGNTWNAGTCCGSAWENQVDDLGFALALLDDLVGRHEYDSTRIYVAGHSNGGMMAYHFARNAAGRIAAMVSVAGCSLDPTTNPTRPVPVLHMHSVDDPRAPWGGGSVRDSGRGKPVIHGILDDSLDWWRQHNGCSGGPRRIRLGSWTHANGGVHTAEKIEWTGGREGSEVVLIRLTGAGHAWPGADALLPERRMGPNTEVINATQEAWHFLRRFQRAYIGQ